MTPTASVAASAMLAIVELVAVAPLSIVTLPVGAVVSVSTGLPTVMLSDLLPLFGVPWLSVTVTVNVDVLRSRP